MPSTFPKCEKLGKLFIVYENRDFIIVLRSCVKEREPTKMESVANPEKPHALCIPYPSQGHINPMLKLAKLLHHNGFHITFLHTDHTHQCLLESLGPNSLNGLPSFHFRTIPDGLPSTTTSTRNTPSLCRSMSETCLPHLRNLISELNHSSSSNVPTVTCIISDGVMSFSLDAAQELGIPHVLFWTTGACAFMAYLHFRHLIDKGLVPFKDESYLTNGVLDTVIDWIPGLNGIRLRDIPSFIRTTDPENFMLNFLISETQRAKEASAIVLNTFEALENEVFAALASLSLPRVYSIGSLQLLLNQAADDRLKSIQSNLWKEESGCLEWLDSKEPNSVIYVNFGSVIVTTGDKLVEIAWGLANSNKNFLWVIRPNLVSGTAAVLPPEFVTTTKERGFLASWCPQEQVLSHPSIGGFLTHSGWNSTLESICGGVPMICWPRSSEQQMNCRYCCLEWGIGMEMNSDVKRDEVERLVRVLMEGKKGNEMKKKAMEWRKIAEEAASPKGSSFQNLDNVVNHVLMPSRN